MIYCMNCLHCKVKVDVIGGNYGKPKYARIVFCDLGIYDGMKRDENVRLLSNVHSMKCDEYDSMSQIKCGSTAKRRDDGVNCNYDNLEWYYENGVVL